MQFILLYMKIRIWYKYGSWLLGVRLIAGIELLLHSGNWNVNIC